LAGSKNIETYFFLIYADRIEKHDEKVSFGKVEKHMLTPGFIRKGTREIPSQPYEYNMASSADGVHKIKIVNTIILLVFLTTGVYIVN